MLDPAVPTPPPPVLAGPITQRGLTEIATRFLGLDPLVLLRLHERHAVKLALGAGAFFAVGAHNRHTALMPRASVSEWPFCRSIDAVRNCQLISKVQQIPCSFPCFSGCRCIHFIHLVPTLVRVFPGKRAPLPRSLKSGER